MDDSSTVIEMFKDLEQTIIENNPSADMERICGAYEYARAAHGEQRRKDGSLYITHPLATAKIIAEMGLDEESIMAGLLHDVIEDTGVTHEEVAKRFGSDVAEIVEGVTKLSRIPFSSKEEEQMENLRKMLLAMAKDIRVILIKIADRLHNMRTMEYQSAEKQREKALETMEIYAPLAHRLGMQKIKWELEDLSILYLDPIAYAEIEAGLNKRMADNAEFFENIQKRITARLRENGIGCMVYGRIKHIYSIYRKMYTQNKEFSEVMDLFAFRVIVSDIADCYNVLGHIHDMFKPIPGHFKDYIGTPKPNGYQSLHTTVIGGEGIPFEVQIRTWEMHHTAEYGIAAHWKYKEGITGKFSGEEKFTWVRRLLESQQDSDAQDFFQALRTDMFSDEVFVFTPRGDVVNLPAGSTPIDFAYNIHSEIGNHMNCAIVNGRIVPFTHILQNGDIVEVQTSKAAKGPSRDWLNIVKSSEARNKIRQWFKKERREENIAHGRSAFEAEMRREFTTLPDITKEDVLPRILKKLAFPTLDEMYAAIGYGGLSAQKAVNRIKDELRTAEKARKKDEADQDQVIHLVHRSKPIHGVMVEGLDNCLVKFARCCTPVPGDEVAGFITRGYGVSVHRKDCPNYIKAVTDPREAGRWVRVNWANSDSDVYQTGLYIVARERSGVVMDIVTVLSSLKIKLVNFTSKNADGAIRASLTLEVRTKNELDAALARLAAISGVTELSRNAG